MTNTIDEDGVATAITLLSVDKNVVSQIKSVETDSYSAVQLGTSETNKSINKAQQGHLKKAKVNVNIMREFRVNELPEELKVGDEIKADIFNVGDIVNVTGTSKGKGWAGTIKRHNFHRQRKTHGGKGNTRQPGSIGSMYPQKIFKGKKMAGQMGASRVTTKNLKIAYIDNEKSLIGVVGSVPGPRKSVVILRGVN